MAEYGYLIHSSTELRDERAINAVFAVLPGENISVEQMWSHGETARPALLKLIQKLLPGDTIFVHSIDRLGKDTDEVVSIWNSITKGKQAHLVVLDTPKLDTRQTGGVSEALVRTELTRALSEQAKKTPRRQPRAKKPIR